MSKKDSVSYNPEAPKVVTNFNNMTTYGLIGQKKYAGVFFEEYEPNLMGIRGINQYSEMMDGDDTIGAIFFAIEMLIRQVEWSVEPQGNKAIDRKAADFIFECLHDMEQTWQDTLSEILSFLGFGWSYHEICYKRRMGKSKNKNLNSKYDDGLIGWRKLPIRAQETLWRWEYDSDDDLVGMSQMALPDMTVRTIPLEKALHFVTKSRKANPEGRSILRNCYIPYYYKKRFQQIEGIGIERNVAGMPVLQAPEGADLWDKTDPEMVEALANAEMIVRNIRKDEQFGMVLPAGWQFSLVSGSATQGMNIGQIITRYDTAMARTCLADFIMLGQQAVGSFALSSDKTNLFSVALGTFLDIIGETFNKQGITRLIDLNGDHFKGLTDYPKLVHGDLEDRNLAQFSTFLKDMVGIGLITPDENLENHVRRMARLPESMEGAEFPQDAAPKVEKEQETPSNQSAKKQQWPLKLQEEQQLPPDKSRSNTVKGNNWGAKGIKSKSLINTLKNKEEASQGDTEAETVKKSLAFLGRAAQKDGANEADGQT